MKKTSHITLTKKGSLCILLNSTRPESPVMTLLNLDRLSLLSLAIKEKQKSPHLILTTDETEQDLGPFDPDCGPEDFTFLAKDLLARARRDRIKRGLSLLAITLLIIGGLSIGGLSVGGLLALSPDQIPSTTTSTREVPTGQVPPGRPGPVPAEDWLRQQP